MDTLAQYIQTLSPQLSAWRRDFHHFAESGWVEFRTAAKVAEILDSLGYELAMGRDVVDAESRMGLPDAATLAQEFARARAQGAPARTTATPLLVWGWRRCLSRMTRSSTAPSS